MNNIYLGKLPSNYNENKDIFLSTASMARSEDKVVDLKNSLKYEVFEDIDARLEARDLMSLAVKEFFLPSLSLNLNHHHGTQYSNEFWGILIKPWLLVSVHLCWYKYNQLKHLSNDYGDKKINVLLLESKSFNFQNITEFYVYGVDQIAFHHWVYSKIIKIFDVNWNFSYETHKLPENSTNKDIEYLRNTSSSINIESIKNFISNNILPKGRCVSIHDSKY